MANAPERLLQFVRSNPSYAAVYGGALNAEAAVSSMAVAVPRAPSGGEQKRYYYLSGTGNVMIIGSEKHMSTVDSSLRSVFEGAIVFFGAVTKALTTKGKSIYDYDAYEKALGMSGLFVSLGLLDTSFHYQSTTVALDISIIQKVVESLGIAEGPEAMEGTLGIAKTILARMGSQLSVSTSTEDQAKKIAHLLIVAENLVGIPLVTFKLFFATQHEVQFKSDTNCSSVVNSTIDFNYHENTFMFIDPQWIQTHAPELDSTNPQYNDLVNKLTTSITS